MRKMLSWSIIPRNNVAEKLLVFVLIQLLTTVLSKSIDEYITSAAGSADQFGMLYSDNGDVLVELDMFLTYEQWKDAERSAGYRGKRKAIRSEKYRWPDNTIPYQFLQGHFSTYEENMVKSALSEWEKYTCVRFRQAYSSDWNRITFQSGGGCSSYVGKLGGSQPVTLGPGCRVKSVIVHEVGHAVGFQHEQTRPDRDGYVTIQNENIPTNLLYNFNKYSLSTVNDYNVPYDYRSIMHYSGTAFSVNGRPTIIAKDARFQNVMGHAKGLSFRDIKLANLMYACSGKCPRKTCPGEGFLGKDCQCYCPGNPVKLCSRDDGATTRSSTTVRTTTPRPGYKCRDNNSRCPYLARRGECARNKGFMAVYCKQSCHFCDGTDDNKCDDLQDRCPFWATRGFCLHRLYRTYMTNNCPESCKVCSDEEGENEISSNGYYNIKIVNEKNKFRYVTKTTRRTTAKPKTTTRRTTKKAVSMECKDNLTQCTRWAQIGYCSRNPIYMKRSCKKACKAC